jgi:acyl-CoA reductase-like NAD-dependent aldehyde dehydrogenase
MSGLFRSINPKNNRLLKEFACISNAQLDPKIEASYQSYRKEFDVGTVEGLQDRFSKMAALRNILVDRKDLLCETTTMEMGKPLA